MDAEQTAWEFVRGLSGASVAFNRMVENEGAHEIRRAISLALKRSHPDAKRGSADVFRDVQEAQRILEGRLVAEGGGCTVDVTLEHDEARALHEALVSTRDGLRDFVSCATLGLEVLEGAMRRAVERQMLEGIPLPPPRVPGAGTAVVVKIPLLVSEDAGGEVMVDLDEQDKPVPPGFPVSAIVQQRSPAGWWSTVPSVVCDVYEAGREVNARGLAFGHYRMVVMMVASVGA